MMSDVLGLLNDCFKLQADRGGSPEVVFSAVRNGRMKSGPREINRQPSNYSVGYRLVL